MDRAVRQIAERSPGTPERTWPLRPGMLAVTQVWRGAGRSHVAAAKGAPEAVFALCRLPPFEVDRLQRVVGRLAAEGLRVLAVATASIDGRIPEDPSEASFGFAGLLGFLDPVRADVPAALDEAARAGIRVVMITGDHPATALAIARAAGLASGAGVLSGAEVTAMSPEELARRLKSVQVFARVAPE
jgi:Ca2+-transporting ATPase